MRVLLTYEKDREKKLGIFFTVQCILYTGQPNFEEAKNYPKKGEREGEVLSERRSRSITKISPMFLFLKHPFCHIGP